MKRLTLAALGLAVLAAVPASAADWSDTNIGYRTGNNFREPGKEMSIQKQIISFGHVSGNSLGGNFFTVDMLKSDANDPVNNEANAPKKGAQEVYVVYRNSLSFSKMTKSKVEFGPVRDIEWTTGFDYSAKNTQFAPSVYKLMTGPTFSFKVPNGFATAGLQYYKEWNHNAFGAYSAGGNNNVVFDGTWMFNGAWGLSIPVGKVDTKFKGFLSLTGPKGQDGANVKTVVETLGRAYWMFDFSPLLRAKKGTWQIGPGFEYWNGKFGDPSYRTLAATPAGRTVNPTTTAMMAALEYHF
jgi:nucleoside-specific outer membrane channel protein Tsx